MPPEVPATVNAGVVVAVATEINPPVKDTLVTVPVVGVVQVMAVAPPAWDVKTCPAEPAVIGRLKLYVPAAACPVILTTPLVVPLSAKIPVPAPANPTANVLAENTSCVFVAGVVPAPPPRTTPPAASNAEDAHVVVLEK